jgi:hypothetical protein
MHMRTDGWPAIVPDAVLAAGFAGLLLADALLGALLPDRWTHASPRLSAIRGRHPARPIIRSIAALNASGSTCAPPLNGFCS